MSLTVDRMTIRPTTQHTGAEIIGIDLLQDLDATTREILQKSLADRGMLVFRNQKLTPPDVMKVAQVFGEILPQQLARFTLPDYPLVGFVSSEDLDKPGGVRIVRGEQYHTDHSNFPAPPLGTMLFPLRLPRVGGDTQFVNVQDSYDDLPEATKRRIDGLRVLHMFMSSRSPRKKAQLTEEERRKIPEAWQPLVLVHPLSGRKALYMNTAHMERIEGMEDDAAFELIGELMAHATQPKYEYCHKWRQGDLVIWDNRSVMHKANGDYEPGEKRFLYRVMIKGQPLQAAA